MLIIQVLLAIGIALGSVSERSIVSAIATEVAKLFGGTDPLPHAVELHTPTESAPGGNSVPTIWTLGTNVARRNGLDYKRGLEKV